LTGLTIAVRLTYRPLLTKRPAQIGQSPAERYHGLRLIPVRQLGRLLVIYNHCPWSKKNRIYIVLQGKYVDHPSRIRVRVADDGTWVSGTSVIVMEGVLIIDW